MATFAPGTLGDPEDDGSDLLDDEKAPATASESQDDGSDDDAGDNPEKLRAENERLRNAHRQLLSEKSSSEEARRENRQLRELLLEMNQRRQPEPVEADPADDVDWDATLAELRRSDDPRDKVTLELTRELYRTKQKLDGFEKKSVEAKDIPAKDMPEVEERMKSGDFRTYRAAHKALLGDRYEALQRKIAERKKGNDGDDTKPSLRPSPARKQPDIPSTTIRSVPRDKAASRKVIKSEEYRTHLQGPDASAWRQRRLSGEIEVQT